MCSAGHMGVRSAWQLWHKSTSLKAKLSDQVSPAWAKSRVLLAHVSTSVASWFMFKCTRAYSPHHCPIDKRVCQDLPSCGQRARGAGYLASVAGSKGKDGALQVVSTAARLRHHRDTHTVWLSFFFFFFLTNLQLICAHLSNNWASLMA